MGHSANNGTVRTLKFDAAGRITESKHTGAPAAAALDQRYDFDDQDRLTGFDGASTSQRFQYDASGNRTRAMFCANTYLNTINVASNRLSSTTGPAPAKQNSFDAAGNLTSDGTIKYSYGSNGRLSGVVAGGVATGYRYNGLGQRVAKTGAAGVTVHYVYDQSGRLLGEYDGAGKAIQETVYVGDLPVAVLTPTGITQQTGTANVYYVYADHLQAPRVLTRPMDNKMVWRWDNADPFGVGQPDENPGRLGVLTYNPRFPGQVFDRETNNHYNYFRDYDPQTGRYIQSDPLGLAGGINTFVYVNDNPLNTIDPTGELGLAGAVIGAGMDLAVQTLIEGKSLKCVSWGQVGMAGALGAVGGGFLGGAFRHAKSGKKWFDLSQNGKMSVLASETLRKRRLDRRCITG